MDQKKEKDKTEAVFSRVRCHSLQIHVFGYPPCPWIGFLLPFNGLRPDLFM